MNRFSVILRSHLLGSGRSLPRKSQRPTGAHTDLHYLVFF
jgi:hypothetical protein